MKVNQTYCNVEFAIKQGGVKLKNESILSWRKYILDFLFYIRHGEFSVFLCFCGDNEFLDSAYRFKNEELNFGHLLHHSNQKIKIEKDEGG